MQENWWDVFWRYGWVFAILVQLLLGWVGWSMRKQFVTAEAFKKFGEELRHEIHQDFEQNRVDHTALDRRVSTLEVQMQSVPSKEALHDLQVSVVRVEGKMDSFAERLEGLDRLFSRAEAVLSRQEQYLMERGR